MAEKPTVIVIGGPTASGKTALSIELAKTIEGEIISADSMQIYEEMNIGTAKPEEEEKQNIPHYLLDFVKPNERYSVAEYKKDAKQAIRKIIERGKTPIVVGGTGLYIDSLIYEIEYPEIEIDFSYRAELEALVKKEGLESLYEKAKQIDAKAMEKISVNDQKRILRVLELYHQTGKTKTQLDKMLEQGLIQEVEAIYQKYQEFPTSMQALGYKEVVEYLEGNCSKEEMIEKIKMESRRYAKRQLTWFRKNKETIWLDGQDEVKHNISIILEEIKRDARKEKNKS